MNRRKFLKLFSAAALSAIAPIDLLAGFSEKRFYSKALHFSFEIPLQWYRPTIGEIKANLAKQTFVSDELDDDIYSPTPLVAFYKYRAYLHF